MNSLPAQEEMMLQYRPFAETERWLKHRFQDTSGHKAAFTTVGIILSIVALVAIAIVFSSAVLDMLGAQAPTAAEYAARQEANQLILTLFGAFGVTALICGAIWYFRQATHLIVSASELHLLSSRSGMRLASLPWRSVESIELHRRLGADSSVENYISFKSAGKERIKLKVAALGSQDERMQLKQAIERFASSAVADASVLEALEPEREKAYTELWLQALAAPPDRQSLQPLIVGAKLNDGKFTVKGCLGVGGQGTAYLCDSNAGPVVLKEFILPVYVDVSVRRQALKAFENEARILQSLNHENVVRLLDFFSEDQRGYLVLEFVDGISLKEKVSREGPFPQATVIQMALQMCSTLSYLHGLAPPVVHRDFAPDNLILGKDGNLKLVDFNVAQQTDKSVSATVVGKHAYMPPEQFRGNPVPQSDIYAFGGVLFFLLTGQDPEPICANHPKLVRQEISPGLDAIVAKATAPAQKERFKDSGEIAALLRQLEVAS